MKTVAIVGASLAGARAAQELRAQGFDGRVVLVGEEPHLPYDRPPLSKAFLAGTASRESLDLLDSDDLASLELRLGTRAERLDAANGRLVLSDGELKADGIVLATGGRARTLPDTGSVAGVHVLRSLDDALALRAELLPGARVVVVGGGFIGAEVASTCRTLGLDVTVLEALETPLTRVLGPQLAQACARLHGRHGTTLRCGAAVAGLDTTGDGARRRVTAVRLESGESLPADVVVVGVGMAPATGWLAGSGLETAGGVHTTAGLVTDLPNVVAAGDVAAYSAAGTGLRHRHEHWTNASEQAPVAVANLLAGRQVREYRPSGYVWSDQYSGTLQLAGHPEPGDEIVFTEGSAEDDAFAATFQRDGRTTAVFALNLPRAFTRLRRQAFRRPAPVS
ncbi:NAD(P)/FAD-dependent oxidoreductase [Amycolatopsis jiangsuensis]|uniref:3-phenylpropionate/trans-cinnamate dioxygenase ferredoxin reductase subunit n=1 Tax=Amycolatopsis jiangsuensis TaxID=1181879 RepID=A0A840IMW2_9PSEU|nr:FAD-dependent oxidoreductase [Amycolatopsis jiangsuensis]MBB4683686.1 3-phenylpropionate/trans-cinnamate dioxygenase ferredoxin reductase subunit [Amycolatopsis jiangsuensis]